MFPFCMLIQKIITAWNDQVKPCFQIIIRSAYKKVLKIYAKDLPHYTWRAYFIFLLAKDFYLLVLEYRDILLFEFCQSSISAEIDTNKSCHKKILTQFIK